MVAAIKTLGKKQSCYCASQGTGRLTAGIRRIGVWLRLRVGLEKRKIFHPLSGIEPRFKGRIKNKKKMD
jgi:hypothetical protein